MGYRQQIHIKIDTEDYLWLKHNKVEISKLMRRLVKAYRNQHKVESNLDKLKKEKKRKTEDRDALQEDIALLNIHIMEMEEKEKERKKKKEKETDRMYDSFRKSGLFEEMVK